MANNDIEDMTEDMDLEEEDICDDEKECLDPSVDNDGAEDVDNSESKNANNDETKNVDNKNEQNSKNIEVNSEENKDGKEKKEASKDKKTEDEKAWMKKKGIKPFVPLHVHSEYSLLDGAARISRGKHSPLLEACVEKHMPGCALTDHGNMFGAYTFYKKAKNAGVKPIIGCELYVCSDMHRQESNQRDHLVLLAKTTEGYRNIVKIDSLAYTEGFYYKPRIDIELLKQHTKGVVCLSACLSGRIPTLLMANDYEGAKEYALMLKGMFEEGDFYIEIQDHGISEQKRINPLLVKIAREIGVKVVATNDTHYIEREDAKMHDVLLCIQTGKKFDDTNRMKFDSDEFYLKDYDEMMETFEWCPEAVTNTTEVMEKCNITIEKEELMPPYDMTQTPMPELKPPEYLRHLAFIGLKERYGTISEEIEHRANLELDIIIRMGFAEYYLIVWDFIHYARSIGIPVGAGRGSGVGSIIAYAIRITNVDPLKYSLLFERFLNPERVSAPDFDIDFCMDRRSEVIDYVVRKYGKDKVCQILALGTMKAKGAIKDVARVYGIPLDLVTKATKPISNAPGVTLDKVLGRSTAPEDALIFSPEVLEIYNTNSDMHMVIEMALKIEGMPRNCSKHAAGVVICREVISDFVPLQKNGDDITTQFQKEEVEELGMLKMDFLGLTTLTDLSKAKQYIFENTGKEIDFEKLGYEDPEVFKLICSGETDAVFQLEGSGMKEFIKKFQPTNLEDIIAGISLYRPGPMDSIPKFIENKTHADKIAYAHPLLEPILKMTYGVLVYQEQVMQIVQSLGGYTLGRADNLRRAMSKKKVDVMKAEKSIFIFGCEAKGIVYNEDKSIKSNAEPAVDGAVKRGVPEKVASDIFDEMESFAKYAFNKSHAAAYAVLGYETAYFKKYHLVEYIAAVINDRITKADEVAKYLNYLRDRNIKILPPDVNNSDVIFRATKDGELRFGLNGIKNVGEQAMQTLVDERNQSGEYKTINDILGRLPSSALGKKNIESLIKAGAFDSFGHTRATLMANYESLIAVSASEKKMRCSGQLSLFEFIEEDTEDSMQPLKEFNRASFLAMEKEVLNIYMTGHPLDELREEFKLMPFNLSLIKELLSSTQGDEEEVDDTSASVKEELEKKYSDEYIVMGGMLTGFGKRVTKSGKLMGFGKLEDLYGAIDVVFFPATLEKYKDKIENDMIVKVKGRLNTNNERGASLAIMELSKWVVHTKTNEEERLEAEAKEEGEASENKKLYVKLTSRAQYNQFADLIELNEGKTSVVIQFDTKLFEFPTKVKLGKKLEFQLESLLGKNCIIIK